MGHKVEKFVGIKVTINKNVLCRPPSTKYYGLVGKTGTIRSAYDSDGKISFGIEITNVTNKNSQYGYFYFSQKEINIQDQLIETEKENEMSYNHNSYKGKYRIATIQFLDHPTYEIKYRVYDDGFDYKVGDYVVVHPAHHNWTIAKIKAIYDYDSAVVADSAITVDEAREIICPIDISKFNERERKAKEIVKLKKEMDKKVKELQGVALYELMAEKSPELQEMLTQYKTLVQG